MLEELGGTCVTSARGKGIVADPPRAVSKMVVACLTSARGEKTVADLPRAVSEKVAGTKLFASKETLNAHSQSASDTPGSPSLELASASKGRYLVVRLRRRISPVCDDLV
jgi:hypothetical protein